MTSPMYAIAVVEFVETIAAKDLKANDAGAKDASASQ